MAFKRMIEIISGPEGGSGLSIKNNYMSFDVEKSIMQAVNKGKVKIFNLTKDSSFQMGKSGNHLTIKAGYDDEDGAVSIFSGNIIRAVSGRDGVNRILEMEAYDGYKNINSKTLVLSYGQNTSADTILNDILNNLAFPVAGTRPNLGGIYAGGFSFAGPAVAALTKVLARVGYKWTIQNEQMYIYEEGKAVTSTGMYLSKDTGLMYVQRLDQAPTKSVSKQGGKHQPGTSYKLISLLFPQIVPGQKVQVKHSELNGWVMVESAKYAGDNFGGDFIIDMEARAV